MLNEQVYERILARVARTELDEKCRDVAQREAKLIERRMRSVTKALQQVYDVDVARQQLSFGRESTATTMALLQDLTTLQSTMDKRMRQLAARVSGETIASPGEQESTDEAIGVQPKMEPAPSWDVDDESEDMASPKPRRRLKRRLSHESVDSPRKPPRPGRLAFLEDEAADEDVHKHIDTNENASQGPHAMPNVTDDEETEDEAPMHLDVLDSDTEFEIAAYLVKARRLRKVSSERRMSELPELINAVVAEVQGHEWEFMPRELLGTLSATLSAATTLKPAHRQALASELASLEAIALMIDETTAKRYTTLLGSRGRFLTSLTDGNDTSPKAEDPSDELSSINYITSLPIEELHTATRGLAERGSDGDDLKSMEQLDEILRLVDNVFDNPTLARSDRYRAMVTASLDILISYVDAIPRTTRRTLQCQELLRARYAQVTEITVSGFERILARVGRDALRDYCSSAIEDELKNLKSKMQRCLESVEKALEVQDAIHKLEVPLNEQNVAAFAAIQSEYNKFASDLGAFIQEQRQIQASQPREPSTTTRDSVPTNGNTDDGTKTSNPSQQRLAKLATKIQHRLSKKHSSTTWIGKNLDDMETIVIELKHFTPEKLQRRELELALDHCISAVLLSPATTSNDLQKLDAVLQQIETACVDLAEFARNSRTLVVAKLEPPSATASNGLDGRRLKRQRIEQTDDFFVKAERQQTDPMVPKREDTHEVRVSDLPWGVNQTEVESYFGVAGLVLSVRMPTMDDGSTVGVAIVRFATADGLHAALGMDGYHFQGRSIRVARPVIH